MNDFLDEPVASIARHDVVTGGRSDTIRMLATKMHDARCSALLVEQRNGDQAIVTERDIVSALAAGADPDVEWAVDVMTRVVHSIPPSATIAEAVELMNVAEIRHVMLDDGEGSLGMVSLRDLLAPLIER